MKNSHVDVLKPKNNIYEQQKLMIEINREGPSKYKF